MHSRIFLSANNNNSKLQYCYNNNNNNNNNIVFSIGYTHTGIDGVTFTIGNAEFCNMIDAGFGYETDAHFMLNDIDVVATADEIRRVAPAMIIGKTEHLEMVVHANGEAMTYLVDPHFQRTVRWILYTNKYLKLDLNARAFAALSYALEGKVGMGFHDI